MTISGNIWMICFKLNWFFYGLNRMLQFSEFVCALSSSVWDVFNNFLLIDATDRSKISSDQTRSFIALSLYPLSFFAKTPFKWHIVTITIKPRITMISSTILIWKRKANFSWRVTPLSYSAFKDAQDKRGQKRCRLFPFLRFGHQSATF